MTGSGLGRLETAASNSKLAKKTTVYLTDEVRTYLSCYEVSSKYDISLSTASPDHEMKMIIKIQDQRGRRKLQLPINWVVNCIIAPHLLLGTQGYGTFVKAAAWINKCQYDANYPSMDWISPETCAAIYLECCHLSAFSSSVPRLITNRFEKEREIKEGIDFAWQFWFANMDVVTEEESATLLLSRK